MDFTKDVLTRKDGPGDVFSLVGGHINAIINYQGHIEDELVEKGFSQEDAALMVRKQQQFHMYVSLINWCCTLRSK